MRRALAANPPPETKRQLTRLLATLDVSAADSAAVLASRALLVVERVGTASAQALLPYLASGEPEAALTHAAGQALARVRLARVPVGR